ncbi:MAG: TonB-dependent receptor, partial [Saprospiraceae bacterium]|nr:TonB-dependent receptor [Saprospiraceae bacterium]
MSTIVKYFAFFFSFLIVISGYSQSYTIQGNLQDENREPLSYATIMLKDTSGINMIKAELTDADGKYIIMSVDPGMYVIETSFLGYINYQSDPMMINSNLDVDPIIMAQDAAQLDEVTITSRRPLIEVQADRTVFNVENTLNATGSNGFELLRKAPGVVIDNNDNIILEGKTGVQIFINGKPSVLSADDLKIFLETLQSTDIDKIEIITQPSSKYDAAGNAGIINIQLKKDKRFGTNGSLSSGYTQGKNGRFNSSVSLNNRGSNYNAYGNYSNSIGQSWNFINLNRFQSGINYDSRSE